MLEAQYRRSSVMKFLIKAAVLTYVVKRIAKSYLSKA